MRHIKLFEEYKYLNIGKSRSPSLIEPTENDPFYRTNRYGVPKKDEKEPFFNRKKREYKDNIFNNMRGDAEKLNKQIAMKIASEKMKITPSEFEELLDVSTRGRGRDTEPMSYYYYYSKEYGYHSLDFCKGRGGEDWSEYLYLMYFEQEDDYIIHKKKFKTVREVIDYLQKGPERMHKRNRAEIRNEPFNEE